MQEIKVGDILKIKYDSVINCINCLAGLQIHSHLVTSYNCSRIIICVVAQIKPTQKGRYTRIYCLLNNNKILIRLGAENDLDGAPFAILSN